MTIEQKIIKIALQEEKKQISKEKNDEQQKKFKKYPHLFLLGCILNSGANSDKIWNTLEDISTTIGYDFKNFYETFYGKQKKHIKFLEKKIRPFSRYHNDKYFKEAIKKIHEDYADDASLIWKKSKNCADVIVQLLQFNGIGIKKATMAINIWQRRYAEAKFTTSRQTIDISPDIHVKRAMCKLGLINMSGSKKPDYNKIDKDVVIYKARAINPKFPALLDFAFWKIGKDKICKNNGCESKKEKQCPFESFCPTAKKYLQKQNKPRL